MAREYKDSGIEWIGLIPKEWRIVPFKAYFTTGKGLSFTKADLTPQGHAVVSYGQVHSKVNTGTRLDDFLLRYIPDSITANGESSKMNKGDFIFADTSEDLEGCGNCVYVDRDIELYAGYHSVTAKPKVQDNNKFFAYYFQTPCWRSQIRSRVTVIKVYSISQSIINQTWLFVPPLLIQQKIADYLDKLCGEVDEMIALQEKMIEELKAYKQSVITEVVTKGLNPNVPMKNSGIDWIGEIPEHWKVIRIKYLLKERKERSVNGVEEPLSMSQKYGLIPTKDMEMIPNMASSFVGAKLVYKNDLVFNKLKAHLGVFAVSDYEGLVSPDYAVYSSTSIVNEKYLEYLFKTPQYIGEFIKLSSGVGAGLTRLYTSDLYSINGIVPPIEEQNAIVSFINTKCSEIDSLIAIKQQKATELKEYKKSVIYEYVTGKKEVV